jgi:hypothetical protein
MKEPHKIIDHLSPNDALTILKTLARDDENLAARIAEMATAHLLRRYSQGTATLAFLHNSCYHYPTEMA